MLEWYLCSCVCAFALCMGVYVNLSVSPPAHVDVFELVLFFIPELREHDGQELGGRKTNSSEINSPKYVLHMLHVGIHHECNTSTCTHTHTHKHTHTHTYIYSKLIHILIAPTTL